MKASDGRELKVLGEHSLVRQAPGPEPIWQDSVVLVWWDLAQGVGGMHRIGHEPNAPGGGKIALWNTLWSPQGIYKKTAYQPLREADRLANGGFGGGDDTCRSEYLEGRHVWTIQDGEVSARLVHVDTGPNVDCYPKNNRLADDFAAAHLDIPGRVSGWLEVKGRRYELAGLSLRDHGWGVRDWSTVLSHRWVAGSAGPELSFVALSWHSSDDQLASFGWVVRGDRITFARQLDILTYVEIDAASNRGGRLRFTLTTGEVLDIECEPLARGAASYHHDVCCIDVMCRFRCGGISGFCDFETTANLQHGSRRPGRMVGTVIDSGFFPA